MTSTDFIVPKDIQEACTRLAECGSKAHILAGGTDLMVSVNLRRLFPEKLIYIGRSGMDRIEDLGDRLAIGAAATLTSVINSPAVTEKAPLLMEACQAIASPAVRNSATIGGNICNASPAADAAVGLLALNASVKAVSQKGERVVPLQDFFTGPGQTVLATDELLAEISVPYQGSTGKSGWFKIGQRKADAISVASAAISLKLENGLCRDVRIALGAVAPTPLLAVKAAAILDGRKADTGLIAEAAAAAAAETSPIDDIRGSAWYRKQVVEAMVKRILTAITA